MEEPSAAPSIKVTPSMETRRVGNSSPVPLNERGRTYPVSDTQAEYSLKPKGAPLRLSRQVGLLLRESEIFGLSVWQKGWLLKLTRNLNPEGIISAAAYAAYLQDHPEIYQSLRPWREYLSRPNRLREVHLKPKRRIGIGYTDKGYMLPFHKKGRVEALASAWIYEGDLPERWWLQYGMLPLYFLREGEWLLVPRPDENQDER